MISIKKYLELDLRVPSAHEAVEDGPFAAAMECCRGVLAAVGRSAVQISPGLGEDLEANLKGLDRRLSIERSAQAIRQAKGQVEVQLNEWSTRASEYYKSKTDEVKELLIVLAETAEFVGTKDQGYANKLKTLTGRLESIANLDDLTQIRSSIVQNAAEMRKSVEQMARAGQELVSQLRAQIDTYENRLKSVEHLALKDELTGLANRRSIEERIGFCIANRQEFSIVMLDLNQFKFVNDTYGHPAGDDFLKQFASELQVKTRSCDLVGRWGGDEFVMVLSCDMDAASAHAARISEWVFGTYTLRGPGGRSFEIHADAAIGVAQWQPGKTSDQLVAEADAAMYAEKKRPRE